MADIKFSEFTEDTDPAITDVVVGLTGSDNKKMQIQNLTRKVQLNVTDGAPSHSPGQIWYDPLFGATTVDMGISGVRNSVGLETYVPFFNATAGTIADGTPVAGNGTYTAGLPNVIPADADNILHIYGFLGIATHTAAPGTVGLATIVGAIQGVDTSLLSTAPVYLASGGGLTNTLPLYPTNRMLIGGVTVSDVSNGVIGISTVRIPRSSASKSYSFTSQGVGAGTYWKGGFYDWSAADANLTQASTSVTYGTAGQAYAAHVGIVPSGAGSVDAGQVGLRVVGTEDDEEGTQTASQTGIITTDITTLTADTLAETSEKFSGDVLIEFYVVSGTPTTYSLDFNYGYSKYEDFQNSDITVTGFETVWQGGVNDSGFDIALMHHKPAGWTYAATGFTPGNGDIVRKSVDQAVDGNVINGEDGGYKRVNINQFVQGNDSEGIIVQIITGQNNTIQTMDIHVSGVSEEPS